MVNLQSNTFLSPTTGKQFLYLSAGPEDGPLMIFLHGWPALAVTWKPQLECFAALGFRVVAPDMPGYGGTWTSKDHREFALEKLVPQFVELYKHVGSSGSGQNDAAAGATAADAAAAAAIWVAHDWGSGPLWALASHHPEICRAVVSVSVPYRTLELGVQHLVGMVDRDLYPEDQHPYGQWDYQIFYEQSPEAVDRQFEADLPRALKLVYARGSPNSARAPARTSSVTKDGGWFGGASGSALPDLPLSLTVLDGETLDQLVAGMQKNGFHGATSWYRNHAANREYAAKGQTELQMPVLFIHTEYDAVCQTVHNPRFVQEMRHTCHNLAEFVVQAGHWGALECPEEVNAGIARWILSQAPDQWPGPKPQSQSRL